VGNVTKTDQSEAWPWFRIRGASGLAHALIEARKLAGLSQDELAERLDVNRLTVSRLESRPNTIVSRVVRAFSVLGYDLVAVPRGATVTVDAAPRSADG
jgi:hypothetical protein